MKTEKIWKQNAIIHQRNSDGYFSANILISEWNRCNPNKRKQLQNYFKTNSAKKYIKYLQKNEGIDNPVWRTTGTNGGTWVHLKVFVEIARWTSIEFKDMVYGWLLDGIIRTKRIRDDSALHTSLSKSTSQKGIHRAIKLHQDEDKIVREILGIEAGRDLLTRCEVDRLILLHKVNYALICDNKDLEIRKQHLELMSRTIGRL